MKKKTISGILFGAALLLIVIFFTTHNKKTHSKQKLTVGLFLAPPYSFRADTDTGYSGFDVELLNALSTQMNMQIEYQEIEFDDTFDLLNKGKIDCAPGMTIRTWREKTIDFSWPYNKVGIQLMKRVEDDSIRGVNDLKGKTIGTTSYSGSPGTYCRDIANREGIAEIKYFKSYRKPYDNLMEGKVDAVIANHHVNLYYQHKTQGRLVCVGDLLTQEFFGIAVAKGNNSLRQKLNQGMQKIMASGEYAHIYNKYIKDFFDEQFTQQQNILNRELVVGYFIFPPYCIEDSQSGELSGFDVELLRAIAKDQNLKLTFRKIPFHNIINLLKKQNVDLVIGLSITPEREQYIDFSWPFNLVSHQLVVTSESNIKSIYDLQGKSVGCCLGTAFDYCTKLKAKGIVEKVVLFDDFDKLFQALISDKIDAIINEIPVNIYYMNKYAGDLKSVGERLTREYIGFGLPQGAESLEKCINKGINNVMASGKYSQIYEIFQSRPNMRMNPQIEEIKKIEDMPDQKETMHPKED
ncbi:MAG: amino acid ABC transporter substrate-binding protein [Victivallales bacterium]|nr:amino acid ABC transporter substrate-binding protein [Victivallales bacterium]